MKPIALVTAKVAVAEELERQDRLGRARARRTRKSDEQHDADDDQRDDLRRAPRRTSCRRGS